MTKARRTRPLIGLLTFIFAVLTWSAQAHADTCGSGALDSGETCDDGNTTSGDGCSDGCQTEAGYVCNGAPSLCCFADAARAYNLIGNASSDANTGEVTLTPDLNGQVGYAWYKQTISFASDFSVRLKLYLGIHDSDGADGGSIMFQRAEDGINQTGNAGGDLGGGFSPLVAVEFDDWDNGSGSGDIPDDHVSIFQTDVTQQISTTVCMDAICSNFEDGNYHDYLVSWTAATHTMVVQIDGATRITLVNDLAANYFSNDPNRITFGFAASTGGATNLQKFCPAAPVGFIVPRDQDGDGADDSTDGDDDNDGIADTNESENTFGSADPGGDHDTDGVPNYEDTDYWTNVLHLPGDCVDVVAPIGACDHVPDKVDADHDGIPNHLDPDSDNDGVKDVVEAGGTDINDDGKKDGCGANSSTGLCTGAPLVSPDSDGDLIPDTRDTDSDNDGILDGADAIRIDACEPAANNGPCTSGDTDGDGILNAVECTGATCPDTDGDGDKDYKDLDSDNDTTLDHDESVSGRTDPCVPSTAPPVCLSGDPDEDGILNGAECATPAACVDTDGDHVADYLDTDSDGDGTLDEDETSSSTDPCNPSTDVAACTTGDKDGDGVSNGIECPNPASCVDTDRDGHPDYDDTDSDNDGTLDGSDSGAARLNPCAPSTLVAICASGDKDGDGVLNGIECPDPAACVDTDDDGHADFDDLDSDSDGTLDASDSGAARINPCVPSTLVPFCISGDTDGDGILNGIECPDPTACVDSDGDHTPDYRDTDSDDDGTPDSSDNSSGNPCLPDTTQVRCTSGDADGDGIPNGVECADPAHCRDTDGDHTPDYQDTDSDGDGVLDAAECPNPSACADADADGLPDVIESNRNDSDGDGLNDATDTDSDGDHTPDGTECGVTPCPDSDHDGIPDQLDRDDTGGSAGDSDGDGVADSTECSGGQPCPDHDGDLIPDYVDLDSDNDGTNDEVDGDRLDPCVPATEPAACASGDADNDGLSNGSECPNSLHCIDSDGDHTPDYLDIDSDDDGRADMSDSAPTDPCVPNPTTVACISGDTDGDGEPNATDTEPNDGCVPNASSLTCATADNDGDGIKNGADSAPSNPCLPNLDAVACVDGDTDGDGARNGSDSDPNDPCVPQASALACASGDSDSDGTKNGVDTAPSDPCVPSRDALSCGIGDTDGDGTPNASDDKPSDPCSPKMQALACANGDFDHDGIANSLDSKPNDACAPDGDVLECPSGDVDNDGLTNADECPVTRACPDTDGDGQRDYLDDDDDNDGIPTLEECPNRNACADTDGDGKPDYLDNDDDGDGKLTADECVDLKAGCKDSDGDGRPDYLDDDDVAMPAPGGDTDGDGRDDAVECGKGKTCIDTDGDGKDDAHDSDDDNDRISTARELADEAKYGRDVDHDGVPNHLDDDSDNDGIPDSLESGDRNGDHVPDYLQLNQFTLVGGGGLGCSASGENPGSALAGMFGLPLLALWLTTRRRQKRA